MPALKLGQITLDDGEDDDDDDDDDDDVHLSINTNRRLVCAPFSSDCVFDYVLSLSMYGYL